MEEGRFACGGLAEDDEFEEVVCRVWVVGEDEIGCE